MIGFHGRKYGVQALGVRAMPVTLKVKPGSDYRYSKVTISHNIMPWISAQYCVRQKRDINNECGSVEWRPPQLIMYSVSVLCMKSFFLVHEKPFIGLVYTKHEAFVFVTVMGKNKSMESEENDSNLLQKKNHQIHYSTL